MKRDEGRGEGERAKRGEGRSEGRGEGERVKGGIREGVKGQVERSKGKRCKGEGRMEERRGKGEWEQSKKGEGRGVQDKGGIVQKNRHCFTAQTKTLSVTTTWKASALTC